MTAKILMSEFATRVLIDWRITIAGSGRRRARTTESTYFADRLAKR